MDLNNNSCTISRVPNPKIEQLYINTCSASNLDLSLCPNLQILNAFQCGITSLSTLISVNITQLALHQNAILSVDLSSYTLLETLFLQAQSVSFTDIDVSNNPLLLDLRIFNNDINAAVNSQVLIDLDTHGLNNGYFRSSIFGGGSLTTAGATAKANLQAKGWTIVGI